ncbi:glycine betaine ABC transporter substrate-binding protein [Nocardiopsis sp. RSe5-2]|uniref:Glycine betaine ABC transporter substrate-binding protein n=1 Tax=Nocardiopsis endophytica TaxID=3018445 RepID=A0ABT4TWK9_9ACTN|nr:glycine betaine ABC transporter substrate-binding protein [Nocardiopsis endophytica]MDA2809062.1 glycine betaine ABC transporter substrate-binding protein [Nocardiopsis endophytica]
MDMRISQRFPRFTAVGAASAALLLAGACGGGNVATGPEEGGGDGGGEKISIGMIAWDEDIAVTHLWKAVLEEKGYDVEIEEVDVAPTFQGLAEGDIDLYMDVWLPVTHESYWEEYGDSLEDLGAWNTNASLQLTVPSYMEDINSIEDLKGEGDTFGGEIVGIESGAGLTSVTKDDAMPAYGLEDEYKLVESSTPSMLEALDTAVADEEPIVVTLWHPHAAYDQYDLKDLEDPEGAMGDAEEMKVAGRDGFSDDHPEVAEWMKAFELDDEQLAGLLTKVRVDNKDDPEKGAREWLSENPDVLEGWMGDDAEGLEF